MDKIRVHVHGAAGRMGSMVVAGLADRDDLVLAGRSGRGDDLKALLAAARPDVLVEFTEAGAAVAAIETALDAGVAVVSGTTGIPDAELQRLGDRAAAAGTGLLVAPNFCLGVILLQRFARQAAAWFRDVEIVELHHQHKRDAPSGTAAATARQIAKAAAGPLNAGRVAETAAPGSRGVPIAGIPVHAVRLPGLLAHLEVLFGQDGQLLTLRHDTSDRRAFLPGILQAIRRIGGHRGLVDSLEGMLDDSPS